MSAMGDKRELPFLLGWSSVESVRADFDVGPEDWSGVEILVAWYESYSYDGDAFVLFRRAGKLYEVNGGHCSCYGLEGQWEPSEVTPAEIEHRLVNGWTGRGDDFRKAVREALNEVSRG